jgi:AraC-like DNA-binding protein
VKEAAQRVGFSDPYHFSRCFRSVHGIPPSRLLHRNLQTT